MDHSDLRAELARRLSRVYAQEVPAYGRLVEVCRAVNETVMQAGECVTDSRALDRITEERHGAVRVGSVAEMRQIALLFAGFGMHPVGFYDLRGGHSAIPVISTGFRPTSQTALERSPFRMFCSLLETADRRFFAPDLARSIEIFVARRQLFCPEILTLAERSEQEGGLEPSDADRFLGLTVQVFTLSSEPVDRAWYRRLEAVSSVAADIAGVSSTHLNHLTPRVLDIDELYRRMVADGVEMIDEVQGPPRRQGPAVLLRQTSFRALAEPRLFRESDGAVVAGSLNVRFGEVEARGVALTSAGMDAYESLLGEPTEVWDAKLPTTHTALRESGLAWYRPDGEPILYEDFLPRSAAGIFRSNLTSEGLRDDGEVAVPRDLSWMSGALERTVHDPQDLYSAQASDTERGRSSASGRRLPPNPQ